MNRKFSHTDLAMISGLLSIIGSIVFFTITN